MVKNASTIDMVVRNIKIKVIKGVALSNPEAFINNFQVM